jgi:hypothetical protein
MGGGLELVKLLVEQNEKKNKEGCAKKCPENHQNDVS